VEFEWDEAKALLNLRKHGVAFEDAIELFDDPRNFSQPAKIVGGEERHKTTGQADAYAVLTIVHVVRETAAGTIMRIISARPASRRERRTYEQQ
jgi:uncharacterized DUF497 family protein